MQPEDVRDTDASVFAAAVSALRETRPELWLRARELAQTDELRNALREGTLAWYGQVNNVIIDCISTYDNVLAARVLQRSTDFAIGARAAAAAETTDTNAERTI
jgi:hypothetical protein